MIGKRTDYDLVVIGSGRSGREEALAAAEGKRKVAIVEAGLWGGDEVNYGGIPLESMLRTSQGMVRVADDAAVMSETLRVRYDELLGRASKAQMDAAERTLEEVREAGIDVIEGFAKFISAHEISVDDRVLSAKMFYIATGEGLKDNKIAGVEEAGCLDVAGVVGLKRMPRTVMVIGAGRTGCELAQYFSGIGSRVLIADIAGRLLPTEDEEVGQLLDQVFNRQHIVVLTQTRVVAVERDTVSRRVTFMQGGVERAVRVDEVVIATGTVPEIHDLGLDKAAVEVGRKGIVSDASGRTSQKHIFVATDAGRAEVTRTVPCVIRLGRTEDECLKSDDKVRSRVARLESGRGFVKTLTDAKGMLCGATFVGEREEILDWVLRHKKEPAARALLDDTVGIEA